MANESERNPGARTLTRRESDVPAYRGQGNVLRPFALLREMTDWMDQAFMGGGDFPIARGERLWAPAVEVRETEGAIKIAADLPGIDQKDVKVEVDRNTLVIQGERKREESQEREGIHRSERFYGTFYRAITLPESAHPEKAKADFKNGVLEVTVPVEEDKEQRRQIPITGATGQSTSPQGTAQSGAAQSPAQGTAQRSK